MVRYFPVGRRRHRSWDGAGNDWIAVHGEGGRSVTAGSLATRWRPKGLVGVAYDKGLGGRGDLVESAGLLEAISWRPAVWLVAACAETVALEKATATKWLLGNLRCGCMVGYDFLLGGLESPHVTAHLLPPRQFVLWHVESSSPHQRRVLL